MAKLLLSSIIVFSGVQAIVCLSAHERLFSREVLSTDHTLQLLKTLKQESTVPDFSTMMDHMIQANDVSLDRCEIAKLNDLWKVVAIDWSSFSSDNIKRYIEEKANQQYETCRDSLHSRVADILHALPSQSRSFMSRITKNLISSHILPEQLKDYKLPYEANVYQQVGELTKEKTLWAVVSYINHLHPVEKARIGLDGRSWYNEMFQSHVLDPCEPILKSELEELTDFFDTMLKPKLAGYTDVLAWEVTNTVLLCRTVSRQHDTGQLSYNLFSRIKAVQ